MAPVSWTIWAWELWQASLYSSCLSSPMVPILQALQTPLGRLTTFHNDVLARWTQFFPRCSSRIFGWYNLSTTYAPWSAVVSGVACWSKYATEALYLYATTQVILSVRQGHRITWNRFCCNHNKPDATSQWICDWNMLIVLERMHCVVVGIKI